MTGYCIVAIHDGRNACKNRDFVSLQAIRVAIAIVTLVVMMHHGYDVLVEQARVEDHVHAEHDVLAHLLFLLLREWSLGGQQFLVEA